MKLRFIFILQITLIFLFSETVRTVAEEDTITLEHKRDPFKEAMWEKARKTMEKFGCMEVKYDIKPSEYAYEYFPPCKPDVVMETFWKAVDTLSLASFSAEGLLVFAGSKAIEVLKYTGGEIGRAASEIKGGSHANCQTKIAILPEGSTLEKIELSNRNGQGDYKFEEGKKVSTTDWAGWRNLEHRIVKGRHAYAATAVNWKHDQHSHQVMRIYYRKK